MDEAELRALADRFMIRELIDEYSNVCTQKSWDRLGELFVEDCVWRTTGTNVRLFEGRDAVVAAITAVVEGYPFVFQMPHAPRIQLDGDRATATTLMHEIGKIDEATIGSAIAVYRDTLVRTESGWKFAERVFDGLYRQAMPA